MLRNYLIAMTALLGMLLLWASVQKLARSFAERNPHLGPFREEGAGCGSGNCSCGTTCSSGDAPHSESNRPMPPKSMLITIQEPQ